MSKTEPADLRRAMRARLADFVARWPLPRLAVGRQRPAAPGPLVRRADARLLLTLSGSRRLAWSDGRTVRDERLTPGHALLVVPSAWTLPHPGPEFTALSLVFQPFSTRLVLVVGGRDGRLSTPHWYDTGRPLPQPGRALLTGALVGGDAVPAAGAAMCRALIEFTLHELDADVASRADAPVTWQRLRGWLDQRLHLTIDRSAAARACGVHPNSLSRLCRRHGGASFVDLVTRLRLDRATCLIAQGATPIGDVGRRCGFPNASYFIQVFRRQIGCTPGAYRIRAGIGGIEGSM